MKIVFVDYHDVPVEKLDGVDEKYHKSLYNNIGNVKEFNKRLAKIIKVEEEIHRAGLLYFKDKNNISKVFKNNLAYGLDDESKFVNITSDQYFLKNFCFGYIPKPLIDANEIDYKDINTWEFIYELFPSSNKIFPHLTNVCIFDENNILLSVSRFWIDRYKEKTIIQSYPLLTKYGVQYYLNQDKVFEEEFEIMRSIFDGDELFKPIAGTSDSTTYDAVYIISLYIKDRIQKLYPDFEHSYDMLLSDDVEINESDGMLNFSEAIQNINVDDYYTFIDKHTIKIPTDYTIDKVSYTHEQIKNMTLYTNSYDYYYKPNVPVLFTSEILEKDIYIYNYKIYLYNKRFPNAEDEIKELTSIFMDEDVPEPEETYIEVRQYDRILLSVGKETEFISSFTEQTCGFQINQILRMLRTHFGKNV